MASATDSRARAAQPAVAMPARPGRGAKVTVTPGTRSLRPASANRRGKLTDDLKDEIRALRARGVSLREIGKRVGIVHSGVYALLRGDGAPQRSHRSRQRFSKCCRCWAPLPVSGMATRGFCDPCAETLCPSIWRAGDPPEQLPANLRKYLQG